MKTIDSHSQCLIVKLRITSVIPVHIGSRNRQPDIRRAIAFLKPLLDWLHKTIQGHEKHVPRACRSDKRQSHHQWYLTLIGMLNHEFNTEECAAIPFESGPSANSASRAESKASPRVIRQMEHRGK